MPPGEELGEIMLACRKGGERGISVGQGILETITVFLRESRLVGYTDAVNNTLSVSEAHTGHKKHAVHAAP